MIFIIPSKTQNVVGANSEDIIEFYKTKNLEINYKPFNNKTTGKEELLLIVNENEFGGKEIIYLNEQHICYLHIYFYEGKTKYTKFKKSCTKKGYKLSDNEIMEIITEMANDTTFSSNIEKEKFMKEIYEIAKNDRYYKMDDMIKMNYPPTKDWWVSTFNLKVSL